MVCLFVGAERQRAARQSKAHTVAPSLFAAVCVSKHAANDLTRALHSNSLLPVCVSVSRLVCLPLLPPFLPAPASRDADAGARLWELSEKLVAA